MLHTTLILAGTLFVAAFGLVTAAEEPAAASSQNPVTTGFNSTNSSATATNSAGQPGRPADKSYRLSYNDVILMRVYQEDDLTTRATVARDGMVSLPLLGSVKLAGKTLDEATAWITELLDREYLVKPQVGLSVVEYGKRRFTVMGQVQRPGPYDFSADEELTLIQAIAMAGGYTRIGAPWKITLQRTVEGEQTIFKLDAEAMAKDRNGKPFLIRPDDTITVGEKRI